MEKVEKDGEKGKKKGEKESNEEKVGSPMDGTKKTTTNKTKTSELPKRREIVQSGEKE